MALEFWGLAVFLIGLAYGWLSPGRQDKGRLFRNGLFIGLLLAIVLALLGFLANVPPLGLANDAIGVIISVVILTLVFILGAWLGDLIEGAPRRGTRPY